MNINNIFILSSLAFIVAFSVNSYADSACDTKFTVESKGTMVGGMGDVTTTMYRRSCDEFAQKQVMNMAGMKQDQLIVQKGGYVYTKTGDKWVKSKEPEFANVKKMREEGKSEKEIIMALGGTPQNKSSDKYLEPCSFWDFFGSVVCYTEDMIPVNIKNQMMEINAVKITRGESGPDSIFNVPDNIPETDFMQGDGMPDMDKIMEDAMKNQ